VPRCLPAKNPSAQSEIPARCARWHVWFCFVRRPHPLTAKLNLLSSPIPIDKGSRVSSPAQCVMRLQQCQLRDSRLDLDHLSVFRSSIRGAGLEVTIASFEPFEEFSETRPRFAGWLAADHQRSDLNDWKRGEFDHARTFVSNETDPESF